MKRTNGNPTSDHACAFPRQVIRPQARGAHSLRQQLPHRFGLTMDEEGGVPMTRGLAKTLRMRYVLVS